MELFLIIITFIIGYLFVAAAGYGAMKNQLKKGNTPYIDAADSVAWRKNDTD